MSTAKLSICEKAGAQLFAFSVPKNSILFERKKMGFSLSALQFGKELLEVKGEAEEKKFC